MEDITNKDTVPWYLDNGRFDCRMPGPSWGAVVFFFRIVFSQPVRVFLLEIYVYFCDLLLPTFHANIFPAPGNHCTVVEIYTNPFR